MILQISEKKRIARTQYNWEIQYWRKEKRAEHGGAWRGKYFYPTLVQAAQRCMRDDYQEAMVSGIPQIIAAVNAAEQKLETVIKEEMKCQKIS